MRRDGVWGLLATGGQGLIGMGGSVLRVNEPGILITASPARSPRGPSSHSITLLIAFESPCPPCPPTHVAFLSLPLLYQSSLKCVCHVTIYRCFCIQSLDSQLSTPEETEAVCGVMICPSLLVTKGQSWASNPGFDLLA